MATVKRRYDRSRRDAQAAATRRDILDAAGVLFTARGYAATSIDAIAADAGVSRETIFKRFGTKRDLFRRWVERCVSGDEEPVPIAQQRWVEAIRASPDDAGRVDVAVAALSAIHERAVDALITLRAAAHADPEIAELWQLACTQRRTDVTTVVAMLTAGSGGRAAGDEIVDVVYGLTSPEMFELLVRQCGWSPERFRRWLADALERLVFDRLPDPSLDHM